MSINIVLFEPEIPPNTGNIARTCAVTGSRLHLIEPFGFSVDDKHLKRAGLDYWELLDLHIYKNMDEFFEKNKGSKFFFVTTKGKKRYTDVRYEDEYFLVFGKETGGLPEEILQQNEESCIRIPMLENQKARSLNLANSVSIVLYEALRQTGFMNLV